MEPNKLYSLEYLIERYFTNTITKGELEELLLRVRAGEDPRQTEVALRDLWQASPDEPAEDHHAWDEKFETMMRDARDRQPATFEQRGSGNRILRRVSVTAAAIVIAAGLWHTLSDHKQPAAPIRTAQKVPQQPQVITPGSNGAILTLSNGENIRLDSSGNGIVALQGKTKIIHKNGQLQYNHTGGTPEVLYNIVTTPKGRQFRLVLSDGSAVWLNAASSIRYPVAFTGKERRVDITGEVYFEVASDATRSFAVYTGNTTIRVLGTHFNVNAYADETVLKTTLLEGKVSVSAGAGQITLKPGQQAGVQTDGAIKLADKIDTDDVLAWKNGFFSFDGTDVAAIMRQIARWYDVTVTYEGKVPDRKFGGEIPRSSNLSDVLTIMEESGIHCKVEGKRIIVLP